MDLLELEKRLFAAARGNPPSDRVPYAFEKRIMSLIHARPALDRDAAWANALWRGAAVCLGVMLLVTAAFHFVPHTTGSTVDLSQDFAKTMLAAVDQDTDSSW